MTAKNKSRLKDREALKGYLFVIPLIIGLIAFFIIPMLRSFVYSLSDPNGMIGETMRLVGLSSYRNAFLSHESYRQTVVKVFLDMLLTTPLVIVFSFFMASVLNQSFKGRTFFRVVLFIPVIIMMTNGKTNVLESQMSGFSAYKDTFGTAATSLTSQISEYLLNIGLHEKIVENFIGIIDRVYDTINLSGIQILIILTGMQSISPALYEAAKVEGGTGWENFWNITFPMVSPLVLTSIIYTVIDSFTSNSNGIMSLVKETAFSKQNYPLASAMSISYFLIIAVFLGLVAFLVSRFVFYYDD